MFRSGVFRSKETGKLLAYAKCYDEAGELIFKYTEVVEDYKQGLDLISTWKKECVD